jgi:hypothetical protein
MMWNLFFVVLIIFPLPYVVIVQSDRLRGLWHVIFLPARSHLSFQKYLSTTSGIYHAAHEGTWWAKTGPFCWVWIKWPAPSQDKLRVYGKQNFARLRVTSSIPSDFSKTLKYHALVAFRVTKHAAPVKCLCTWPRIRIKDPHFPFAEVAMCRQRQIEWAEGVPNLAAGQSGRSQPCWTTWRKRKCSWHAPLCRTAMNIRWQVSDASGSGHISTWSSNKQGQDLV